MQKGILLSLLMMVLGSAIIGSVVFAYNNDFKTPEIPNPITSIRDRIEGTVKKSSPKDDYVNILLIGVGGEGHEGANLTDTMILAQIDNVHKKINMVSVPRDFLVYDNQSYYSKINALYQNALSENNHNVNSAIGVLSQRLYSITGIKADHYVKADFEGFIKLIDTLGGVDVNVTEVIDDKSYPGPNFSYDPFYLGIGPQHLDGKTALKYVRSRHSVSQGDLGRAKRQQEVINVVKKHLTSLNPILEINKIVSIIGIFKDNVATDFSLTDMKDFYDTYKDTKDYTSNSLVIGDNLEKGVLKEDFKLFGRQRGYVLVPRAGDKNYLHIREQIHHLNNIELYNKQSEGVLKERATVQVRSSLSRERTESILGLLKAKGIQADVAYLKSGSQDDHNSIQDESLGKYPATLAYFQESLGGMLAVEPESSQGANVTTTGVVKKSSGKDMVLYLNVIPEFYFK